MLILSPRKMMDTKAEIEAQITSAGIEKIVTVSIETTCGYVFVEAHSHEQLGKAISFALSNYYSYEISEEDWDDNNTARRWDVFITINEEQLRDMVAA